MTGADATLLTIGQLAAHVGVSVKAVRHYHRLGLLPEPGRDASGYRRYGAQDVIDLTRIRVLHEAGIPLRDIPAVLRADADTLTAAIDQLERDLEDRIAALKHRKTRVRQLAAGDSLYLPTAVVALLDHLRGLGVPESVVAMERDSWVIWSTRSHSDDTSRMAQAKLKDLTDPAVLDLYLAYARAAAWHPDDPRLAELAHQWTAARQARPATTTTVSPTTLALLADRFADTSPAFARLLELTGHQLPTPATSSTGDGAELAGNSVSPSPSSSRSSTKPRR